MAMSNKTISSVKVLERVLNSGEDYFHNAILPVIGSEVLIPRDAYGPKTTLKQGFRKALLNGKYLYPELLFPDYYSLYSESVFKEVVRREYNLPESSYPEILYKAYSSGYDYTLVLKLFTSYPIVFGNNGGSGYIYEFVKDFLIGSKPFPFYSGYFLRDFGFMDLGFNYKKIAESFVKRIKSEVVRTRSTALLLNGLLPADFENTPFLLNPATYTRNENFRTTAELVKSLLKCKYYQGFDLVGVIPTTRLEAFASAYRRTGIDFAKKFSPTIGQNTIKAYVALYLKTGSLEDFYQAKEEGFTNEQLFEFSKYINKGIDYKKYVYDTRYSPDALRLIRKGIEQGVDVKSLFIEFGDEFGQSKNYTIFTRIEKYLK